MGTAAKPAHWALDEGTRSDRHRPRPEMYPPLPHVAATHEPAFRTLWSGQVVHCVDRGPTQDPHVGSQVLQVAFPVSK